METSNDMDNTKAKLRTKMMIDTENVSNSEDEIQMRSSLGSKMFSP